MLINHEELKKVVRKAYNTKLPLDIKGTFGIGKSEGIKAEAISIAKDNNLILFEWNDKLEEEKIAFFDSKDVSKYLIFIDIRASQILPEDLRLPDLNGQYTKWVLSLFWKMATRKDANIIIFFDEMNHATPSVQKLFYQVLNDKQLGETALTKNLTVISAGNLVEDHGFDFDEPIPLRDRRAEYQLDKPTTDDWIKWAYLNNINMNIIGYLSFQPTSLYSYDPNSSVKPSSPRGWARVSVAINNETPENYEFYASGWVGDGIAKQFGSWIKLKNKVDIKDLLKHPEKMEKIKEIDLRYAILTSVIETYRNDNAVLDNALELCNYIEDDFSMFMIKSMKSLEIPKFREKLIASKSWKGLAVKFSKYLL
jgi:hypothetical protein